MASECRPTIFQAGGHEASYEVRTDAGAGDPFSVKSSRSSCRGPSAPCPAPYADKALTVWTQSRTRLGPFGEALHTVNYLEEDGLDQVLYMSLRSGTGPATEVVTFQPPARDGRFGLLAPGDQLTSKGQATTSIAGGTPVTRNFEVTTTYLGQESLALSKASYNACKFRISDGTRTYVEWIEKPGGVRLKLQTETGPKYTEELIERTYFSLIGI